ncbi:Target of rapamycin complex 1 subunit mip1 {ECO:0000305/PubMed:18076573} Short=TORC1 subunit mip1 [Serendipita indica DSM 11827]|uniref:Related to KOG1-Subunit of TORC1, a rapamycin-sensitive complex involved in growth control n=1 Tax=Serendipita indica (strain DSM 11827) TaxID=1109443 RepID=G4TT65_SERID|nr:Target of rapamycin complex 1 subunit mip1 {ECO:0000305/PubMed:18076573} Short=TORC1 subunit mip1 [Serendipita indica DSM 11827]CCA74508.1 related to KOG1-Subunit of TORC1, a rapamycin-sensitive complex involved in growth control [Serendipita indica DSM 11827]
MAMGEAEALEMGHITTPMSIRSLALVESEGSIPEIIQLQKPWLYKRHLTNGNPSPSQARHNRFHQWRLQDKLKTGNGAIVVCLNLDVDPPDVVKTQPCAVLEGWVDPRKLGSAKALEAIGKNLCQQFQSLNPRIKYKPFLDPSIDEARRFCVNLRKTAKDERLCFYYNGHGVPKPTSSGELWVFNKTYSQYIPVSLYDLQTWLGSPVVYVWDCSAAGNLVTNFIKYAKKRDEESVARHGGHLDGSPPHSSAIQLAACLATETLPMAPDMPADMFTSCLTSPIEMALRFYYLHQSPPPGVTLDMLHEVPGDLKDRRTPLGELNWIFTAVTDTIAWTSFPRPIFKRLFRQDLLVAALFRNFLLAERVMRNYHCTPHTIPALPSTATHPLWAAWDRSLEDIIKQLPDLIKSANPPKQPTLEIMEGKPYIPTPFKYEYKPSSFFTDHLTAFEHWMSQGGGALIRVGPWSMSPLEDSDEETPQPTEENPRSELVPRKPPAQLPILLQVLLSQAHRMRALTLLCQFVDLGPWAVYLVLEIGIYPYVQKLLLSPQSDLKPLLIFIWSRLIAFDKTCQVDLLRDLHFTYFGTILDYSNPVGLANTFEHRAMCAFILASLCRDHPQGQAACLAWNDGALIDFYRYHMTNSSDFLLKQWCCLAMAQMWDGNDDVKERATMQNVPNFLLGLLQEDVSCEVRASALYALAIYCGATGSANDEISGEDGTGRMTQLTEDQHLELEFGTAYDAIRIIKSDASPIVRKEAVVLISALANEWRGYFIVAAWVHWEEEKAAKSADGTASNSIADNALEDWMRGLRCRSAEAKRQHRKLLNKVFFLLTHLYDLAVDPHVEVATLAMTVVDFITAMLLESPFARIQGTTVRALPNLPSNSKSRTSVSSAATSAIISRQGSTANMAPQSPNPGLTRTDSTTRSTFPGLMRTSSIASALGSLAGLALGTPTAEYSAPPSPSLSHKSDPDSPPGPAVNIARYISPYPQQSGPTSPLSRVGSSSSVSSQLNQAYGNGQSGSQHESFIASRYMPSDIVTALIARDLIRFSGRRRSSDNNPPGHNLWQDFNVDKGRLDELGDIGLDAGATLVQTLPLKSKLYDWCLEYYKEPQMRHLDEDEPGSVPYTRQLWRRDRDEGILRSSRIQGQQAPKHAWGHTLSSWKIPFSPSRMTFHHFDSHVAISNEGTHISLYDWRSGSKLNGFNNGNPKGTTVTSLHFVDEEIGGALVVGSSDGVVKIYNNYDPAYSDGQPIQLVSGFRALPSLIPATRGVGIVSEWNQPLTRLLCGGDSDRVYDWDAISERCVTMMPTEENCPVTSITSNPHSRRSFVVGFGNGALKVFDTRARSVQMTCIQTRREHRAYIVNLRYQTGASKQLLSASVDGSVHLWDLRFADAVVQSWDIHTQGLAAFDVHPNSNVFVATSSLGRSWRNQAVSLYGFTSAQEQRAMQVEGVYQDSSTSILNTTYPTGITAPSRAHVGSANPHVTQSVVTFHPAEMFFALGTADGTIRLQGPHFANEGSFVDTESNGPVTPLSNGYQNGRTSAYFDHGDGRIDFPTIR